MGEEKQGSSSLKAGGLVLGHRKATVERDRTQRIWKSSAVAVVLFASACVMDGMAFTADERVHVVMPADNASVRLPFKVAWTVEDFAGSFALFLDRSPVRLGRSLRSLVPDDDPCRVEASCLDRRWLAERNIYVTNVPQVTVEQLPDLRSNNHAKDRHILTLVLLDGRGERVGESAFTTEFVVER